MAFLDDAMDWCSDNKSGLLIAAGITAFVGAVATAIAATPKAIETVENNKIDRKILDEKYETANETPSEDHEIMVYPEEQYNKDVTKARLKGAGRVLKHYIPTIACTGVGIACICAAHGIDQNAIDEANEATSAALLALSGVTAKFDEYRGRVIKDQGVSKDADYYYGPKKETSEENIIDEEGEERKITSTRRETDRVYMDSHVLKLPKDAWVVKSSFRGQSEEAAKAEIAYYMTMKLREINKWLPEEGCFSMGDIAERLGLAKKGADAAVDPNTCEKMGWLHIGACGSYNNFITDGKYDGAIDIEYEVDENNHVIIAWDREGNGWITLNCANIDGMIPTPEDYDMLSGMYPNWKHELWAANPETQK